MSGHSKWKNIMHKKEKSDAQKASVFTKIGREITLAVKEGGPDPASNSKLKDIIAKAKTNNVPNDNIERVIKKAAGDGDNTQYEEILQTTETEQQVTFVTTLTNTAETSVRQVQ